MKRIGLGLTLLALLALATTAQANGIIQGTVLKTNGLPVFPCKIHVFLRGTTTAVTVSPDTTLPNGHYSFGIADGRYDLSFRPVLGTHTFQGLLQDQRVQANTITSNITLPLGQYCSGRVVDKNGAGVPSTDLRFKNGAATPNNVQDNGTNPDGTFNALVDAGTWTVEIIPANSDQKAPVEYLSQDLTVDLNLGNVVVQDGFVLTCSVTDSNLFPITNASVIARSPTTRVRMFTPVNNTTATGVATIVLPVGTYDVSAIPPPGTTSLATTTQYDWVVSANATLPNFALPPGRNMTAHVVAAGTLANVVNADIDVDFMSPPTFPRIETPNDFTDALGNFTVIVPSGTERLTINPVVASKLLPIRLDNIVVGASGANLGTLTCQQGHWIDVTLVAEGTGVPIQGGNIDLINKATLVPLITIDDVTGANGTTRIVSDNSLYTLRVAPPSAAYDTAVVATFRTLQDTAVTVVMPRHGVAGVGPGVAGRLRFASPWPNPSRNAVQFAFSGTGEGELAIVDVQGRRVATPWRGALDGSRAASWPARDESGRAVPDGIYFAILTAGGERSVHRIVVAN